MRRCDKCLKKSALKPWLKEQWVIAPKANAEFVWHMEDVLEVYQRPVDPNRPLVCLDEASRELHDHSREPLPLRPSQPVRQDYEYVRNGTCNVFMLSEPLIGERHVFVRERRTRIDFAQVIKTLVDELHPTAERIVLVMDQLNTHNPASLYEAFPPEEARRLTDKLEIHYTPKHGSWLNMAEIELSVLSHQCLKRRLPNQETLAAEVSAWQNERNASKARISWQFTTKDARIKLRHLYPSPET